ncbi:MAG: hypothetical protein AAF802_05920 [Planctomycetota bacterium]
MAETLLEKHTPNSSKSAMWKTIRQKHAETFTQVRQLKMAEASIRLPEAKLFVQVIPQDQFDTITDPIPRCVRTRLDEFVSGPQQQLGAKVYYVKPLCVELGNELVFTEEDEIRKAIRDIQEEAFAEFRKQYWRQMPTRFLAGFINAVLWLPRAIAQAYVKRKQCVLDAYHSKLEFQRRKTARRAMRLHQRCRTDGCTFDEMLSLTNPLKVDDVVEQFAEERQLSSIKRKQLLAIAAKSLPWFATLSITAAKLTAFVSSVSAAAAVAPILVCDPAFVAEVPGSNGQLLKIGHFDEVDGVMHVEI